MDQSPFWVTDSRSTDQETPLLFTEFESSLRCSQDIATCSYAEPAESSQHPRTLFP
jgi:hypothetical protein